MNPCNQLLVLAVATALIAGCASGNYQKGSAAGAGLEASADKISQSLGKVDATLASLNDLVNHPGDLVAQFKKFSASVSDLESSAKDFQTKVADMRTKGNAYFKAWDERTAQIHNPDIKNLSAARRTEMQQKFTEITTNYAEASEAFTPFLSDLRDIRTALSTDLTPGGVAAIKSTADKATKEGAPLKASMEKLAGQFRDLGAAMSAAVPPPAPTK